MGLDWFHSRPSWVVILALMVVMMIASEVGFLLAGRGLERAGDGAKGHFGAVQGSLLGLLALLLGFTFSMSSQRYDARRQLMMDDANAIMTLYLRSSLLPEPPRKEFKQLLRQYVDIRTDTAAIAHGVTPQQLENRVALSERIHGRMWELARREIQSEHPPADADTILAGLEDVLRVNRRRIYAYEARVPEAVLLSLVAAAVAAAGAVGFSGGLGRSRGMLARIMVTIFVGGTIFVILDLDKPRQGVIRVEQTPILRVRDTLDRDIETNAANPAGKPHSGRGGVSTEPEDKPK